MLEKVNERLYNWLNSKYTQVMSKAEQDAEQLGHKIIKFSGILSVILILSPLSQDFAINIIAAGILIFADSALKHKSKMLRPAVFAAIVLMLVSMLLGLEYGIGKGGEFSILLGTVVLIVGVVFGTQFARYAYGKKCASYREKDRENSPPCPQCGQRKE